MSTSILKPSYRPRKRRRPIRHTLAAGTFAPGQFVRVTTEDGAYLATVEQAVGGMARVRGLALDRGVETVAERKIETLDRDGLADAALAFLSAGEHADLRNFVRRALAFHSDVARALPGGYSILIGDPVKSRFTVELYRDGDMIVAAQRYTFRQLAWAVRG